MTEFERSDVANAMGIDNRIPSEEIRNNLNALADNVLQPLRDEWGKAMPVNSGYRCPALNKAVGGVYNSQHMKGEAADIRTSLPYDLASLAVNLELPFDQLGVSNNFIHISHKRGGGNRQQVFYYKAYKGHRL